MHSFIHLMCNDFLSLFVRQTVFVVNLHSFMHVAPSFCHSLFRILLVIIIKSQIH